MTAYGDRVSFGNDEKNILDLIEMWVAQYCDCTKCHGVVPFQMVDFVLCELYLNFALKKSILQSPLNSWWQAMGLGHLSKRRTCLQLRCPFARTSGK